MAKYDPLHALLRRSGQQALELGFDDIARMVDADFAVSLRSGSSVVVVEHLRQSSCPGRSVAHCGLRGRWC